MIIMLGLFYFVVMLMVIKIDKLRFVVVKGEFDVVRDFLVLGIFL